MSVSSISTPKQIRYLTDLRKQMDSLQKQFATSRKADTYGGLGRQRVLDLSLKQQLSQIDVYNQTISITNLRLDVLDTTHERLEAIRIESKTATDRNNFQLFDSGRTSSQSAAEIALLEFMSHLNTDVGGRYLFSGQEADTMPVVDLDYMMSGDGTHAGLKTVISEYNQADLGALGNGRMTTATAGTTVTLAEDGDHPFGFKIDRAVSTLSNVTVTDAAGPPATTTVDFTGQPQPGETIRLFLDLPDGTQSEISLSVATGGPADPEFAFALGATPDDTALNFQAALDQALAKTASTELKAASTMRASNAFFDTAPPDPVPPGYLPLARVVPVAGDFTTATTLRDGTADTVAWYQGDNTAGNPRQDARAQVDENLTVAYGARANEKGYREVIQALAAFVASDFSSSVPNNQAFYQQIAERANDGLTPTGADYSGIVKNHMEIAVIQSTVTSAEERHKVTTGTLETVVDGIEGVDLEEVAAKLLRLQTLMEASYQATSISMGLSLANYI